jgi:predicted ATP-binding protein involved in virulence
MRGEGESNERMENNRLDGYLFSLDPRINFADLFRWLREERYVSLEKGGDRFGFAAVKRAMCACLEDCDGVDYHVSEKALIVETRSRGRLPFDLLSDGQKSMLALVADIAFKAALLNPQLGDRVLEQTPGVVFIDELDLHIHPRWQRRLVADLKKVFPAIQFFATTHSPQVVGETPPEQIMLLHRDGSWSRPKQTVGLSSNQVLEHIMGAEALNGEMATAFTAVFNLVEAGDFEAARKRIAELRGPAGHDFAELIEAENYMQSVEGVAREGNA